MIKLISLVKTAFAAHDLDKAAKELAGNSPIQSADKIFEIMAKIVQYAYTAFFILAVLFILMAAFNFLMSKGDPEKVKSARSQIMWACVAIAIALVSVGAAAIIKGFVTIK